MKIDVKGLSVWYGKFQALRNVSLPIPANAITAIIGPSGCGKSTLLRTLNRMNDEIHGCRVAGQVLLDGTDIFSMSVTALRKRVGMVFQRPNPFAMSVFENIAFGPKIHGMIDGDLKGVVVDSLRSVGLEELTSKLDTIALRLSLEQQQRLCIARALATRPEVILLDEPCSALDPQATAKIEELLLGLCKNYTVVIVTHNMQQAARISHHTAFMLMGDLVEYGKTGDIFTNPQDKRTEQYITGRYG